ncbi:hypothetical protein R1flu_002323 [Riccia fluitans]|uniref:NB-ARC domain-containing protein n=1 Tax=Riccia fluitans TaxID=41844 RepID=A0ABD1Y5R2_9MARC
MPHLGAQLVKNSNANQRVALLHNLKVLCKQEATINEEFLTLRHLHEWMLMGISEGIETRDSNAIIPVSHPDYFDRPKSEATLLTDGGPPGSDVHEFFILPEDDYFSISKPKSKHSRNYLYLVSFVKDVLHRELITSIVKETRKGWLYRLLNFSSSSYVDADGCVEEVIRKLHLEEIQSSRLALAGASGVGKTSLAKKVFVAIMRQFQYVCFIEDLHEKLKHRELSSLLAQNLFRGSGAQWNYQGESASIWHVLKGKKILMIWIMSKRWDRLGFFWIQIGVPKRSPDNHFSNSRGGAEAALPHLSVQGGYLSSIEDESQWQGALTRLEEAESGKEETLHGTSLITVRGQILHGQQRYECTFHPSK